MIGLDTSISLCNDSCMHEFITMLKGNRFLNVHHMCDEDNVELTIDGKTIATNYEEMVFQFKGGLIHATLDGSMDFSSEIDIREMNLCLYKMVLCNGAVMSEWEAIQNMGPDVIDDIDDIDDIDGVMEVEEDEMTNEQKYGACCVVIPLSDLHYEVTHFSDNGAGKRCYT